MLLLEPALHTLDILLRLRQQTTAPVVPFSVSGEFAQLTHNGTLRPEEYRDVLVERLTMFKRSGAAMTVTYSAGEAARTLIDGTAGLAVPLPRTVGTA